MAQPDQGDLHVSSLLTNVSGGYRPGGHISDLIFPIVRVDHQKDTYAKVKKSAFARDEGRPAAGVADNKWLRAPGTAANVTGFDTDNTTTFRCDNFALGFEIPDEVAMNADPVWDDVEGIGTILLTSLSKLRRDRAFSVDFVASGVWGTDATITNKWNDYGAGTPIEDMRTQLRVMRRAALATPGGILCVTMGALVWDRLADHPDLLDRIKYTQGPAVVGPDLLGQLLSNSMQYPVEVHVGNSVVTDDEEGTAEASVAYTDVYDDDVLFTFKPPAPGRMFPTSGYTFLWAASAAGANGFEYMRRIREERERKTIVEVSSYWDQTVVDSTMGITIMDSVD